MLLVSCRGPQPWLIRIPPRHTADDSSQLSDVDNNPGRCQLAGGSTLREAMSHEERSIAATSPPTEENSKIVVGRPMSPFSSPQNTAGRILQDGCAVLAGSIPTFTKPSRGLRCHGKDPLQKHTCTNCVSASSSRQQCCVKFSLYCVVWVANKPLRRGVQHEETEILTH
jgi:hypothetical protein